MRRGGRRRFEIAEDAVEVDCVRAQLEMVLFPFRPGGRRAHRFLPGLVGRGGRGEQRVHRLLVDRLGINLGERRRGVEQRIARRQVGAHERRLAAQTRRDQGVGIGLAEQHQRAPEALDVRVVPRLPRHEVLGDEPRFGGRAGGDVGVRELRLRAVHRRLEAAVDADLDQPHERRNVVRHAGDEFLQRGRGRGPVRLRDRRIGGELDDPESRFRLFFGDGPAEERDLLAARRILLEQTAYDREAVLEPVAAKLDVRDQQQQLWIVAGVFDCEVLRRRRRIAARDERARELRPQLVVVGMAARGLTKGLERAVRVAAPFLRRTDHAELLD